MAVNYGYRKGIDLPAWQWMAPFPGGPSYHGTAQAYDGARYQYWVVQYGSTTSGTNSTTQLWRYDMWSNAWGFLSALTNSNVGVDLEIDTFRNVLYIINGNTTAMQVFNLNLTAVTVFNQAIPAFSLATITLALPATIGNGGGFCMPADDLIPTVMGTYTADTVNNTTTQIKATNATGNFTLGMVGLQIRPTSGNQTAQDPTIVSVIDKNTITISPAMPAALASGDTFVLELTFDNPTSATSTTITDTTASWITNKYANQDVVITSGTGAGQRFRIASNTATVLTLASAVTGNARTGSFTTTPDTTSVYRIVPSHDFLYLQVGNSTTTFYKIDVAQTTGTAWNAQTTIPGTVAGGGTVVYALDSSPYGVMTVRGNGTQQIYLYDTALNTWSTLTTFGLETLSTGAGAAMIPNKRKMIIQKDASNRLYILDLMTGIMEPAGTIPYSTSVAYDGHRLRALVTPDGALILYILRAGGQEFFRVPLEWV